MRFAPAAVPAGTAGAAAAALLLAANAGAAALAMAGCGGGPGARCADDARCDEGLYCETSLPDGYCTADCSAGAPCPDGTLCRDLSGLGLCLAACGADRDCRDAYVCQDGACDLPCMTDWECAAGQRCRAGGRCVTAFPPCDAAPFPEACPCTADADCASGNCAAQPDGNVCTPLDPPFADAVELGAFVTTAAAGTGDVAFSLPGGTTSFTLLAEAFGGAVCLYPRRLVAPGGAVWFDHDLYGPLLRPWPGFPVMTTIVPDNDWSGPVPAGGWTVSLDTYDCSPGNTPLSDDALLYEILAGQVAPIGGAIDRLAVLPKAAPGGRLHLNVHLTPASALDAATAPDNSFVIAVLERFWQVYGAGAGGAGLERGVVRYFDAPAAANTIDSMQDLFLDCAALADTAADGGPAINVVLIGGFDGDLLGALGVAAGIPGALVNDHTYQACVHVTTYPFDAAMQGTLVAHEVGHLMGLFHTTELGGLAYDYITDTPECPAAYFPDGYTSCPDFANLMFPIANADEAANGAMSPGQALVVGGAPVLR
ncbi:MAG TPA: hypothetical protein VG389_22840 [Myxococcota bacterium]|jgi:hypothetical protein|nr:hypothetical protein [Myxococcota bacterium]